MTAPLVVLPPAYASTREAMHTLAEQVLSAARYRAVGRIGLRPTPGGIGTPPFGQDEAVRVEGVELVHQIGDAERRAPITTAQAAAAFVGIPLGAPPVYRQATPSDPDAPLAIDAASAAVLAQWFAFGDAQLAALRARHDDVDSTDAQLWPEHFDLAIELGDAEAGSRGTYGASPGDSTIAVPYLYVSPWDPKRRQGPFAQYMFGAALAYDDLLRAPDPATVAGEFLDTSTRLLVRSPE
jgi:hypothetical protein